MIEALSAFYEMLKQTLFIWVIDFYEFFTDLPVVVWKNVLDSISYLISLIPVPDFITSGMQSYFNGVDSGVLWLLNASGMVPALALVGAGFSFKVLKGFIPFVRL